MHNETIINETGGRGGEIEGSLKHVLFKKPKLVCFRICAESCKSSAKLVKPADRLVNVVPDVSHLWYASGVTGLVHGGDYNNSIIIYFYNQNVVEMCCSVA